MTLEIKKIKKTKNKELIHRRHRLFRWGLILLITWYGLQYLPNPEVSKPEYNPQIEKRLSKFSLGDTSSFDKLESYLEQIINTNSPALISELEKEINIQRQIHIKNFKNLHEEKLTLMKSNDINYKINNLSSNINFNEIKFNLIQYIRQVFDPTLNFLELLSNEEKIHELENSEYITYHSNFYVESRLPNVLRNEIIGTFKQVGTIQNKIKDLDKKLPADDEVNQKVIQERINNYKDEIKYIYLQHQTRLYNNILPYFTKSNQEVPEYSDLGDELIKRLYSLIKKSVAFFENLFKDEIIIEVGTIYILFGLSLLSEVVGYILEPLIIGYKFFEFLKSLFFKILYVKAKLTSGINNGLQKAGRFIEKIGDRIFKFQNMVLERDDFPKIRVFNQGKFDFEATINHITTKIIDFFDQSDTRFISKSNINLIFGDIRYFRDLLLNTKMILQLPIFLIEKESIELAWDMIIDGEAPFIGDTFDFFFSEDSKRLKYSLQVLTHTVNENRFNTLQRLLKSWGFNLGIEKRQVEHDQVFFNIYAKINEKLSYDEKSDDDEKPEEQSREKSLSELRHDICLINKLIRYINKYGLETITLLNIFFSHYKSLISDMEIKAVNNLEDKELDFETSNYYRKQRNSSFEHLLRQSGEYMDVDIFLHFYLTPYHFEGKYLKFWEISENEHIQMKGDINSTFYSIYDSEFMNFLVHLQAREMVYKLIRREDIIGTIIDHTIENLSQDTNYTRSSFLSSLSNFVCKDPKDFWERKKSIFI